MTRALRGMTRTLRALLVLVASACGVAHSQDSTASIVRPLVAAARHPWARWPDFPRHVDDVARLYASRADARVWHNGTRLSRAGRAAIDALFAAGDDGLAPRDYDAATLDSLARASALAPLPPADRARFDLLLSIDLIRYIDDLKLGRTHPQPLGRATGAAGSGAGLDRAAAIGAAIAADTVGGLVAAAQPKLVQYRNLKAALARYRRMAEDSAPDVTLSWRVRQIELALERLRWLPPLSDRRVLAVNIPAFELFAFDSAGVVGAPALEMKVIVGRALDRRTPMLLEQMRYVEFRPYWNVPHSITVHEIIPELGRRPDYLAANDMEIVGPRDSAFGDQPAPDVLERLTRGELRIRQRPGPDNALGLIKFVFPNAAGVYLHATPAPELFAHARRDFSHGCIRLEDPVALAVWALRDQPGWSRDSVEALMAGSRTVRVLLTRPLPVVIFYTTAIVRPDGRVWFSDDIYGHDVALDEALRAGPTTP
jgi:murein L,D-transpeptidase YcbB/YkuD